jgi:hypothetical protein
MKMQLTRPIIITGLALISLYCFGQNSQTTKINTSAAEAYFKIADALKSGGEDTIAWQTLFRTPVYQMMIAGQAIDTAALKAEMKRVFAPSTALSKPQLSGSELYHKSYKDNQKQLESYIGLLHRAAVQDSVKALVYPFLPLRLQSDPLFPILFYLNYGTPDATGYGGIVINDLLQSYRIDNYKLGLLAAHEAFHSIVSVAFQKALKKNIDYNAPDFNLLYFLENVSEEGIADLIDKPLLLKKESPVYEEVKQLTNNDDILSTKYIRSIDSILKLCLNSEQAIRQYNGFADFANAFGRNGGHIPGRFMGTVIQKAGLLQEHVITVEDPISFIFSYNEAAKKYRTTYPVFSKESIEYLKQLKSKYWQE